MMNMVTRLGMPIIQRPLNLGYRRPILGQSSVLDNRVVGLLTNGLATALGVTAGLTFRGGWRTVGWVVALMAGIRAWNDLAALTKQ
jgi:hypothetical protein